MRLNDGKNHLCACGTWKYSAERKMAAGYGLREHHLCACGTWTCLHITGAQLEGFQIFWKIGYLPKLPLEIEWQSAYFASRLKGWQSISPERYFILNIFENCHWQSAYFILYRPARRQAANISGERRYLLQAIDNFENRNLSCCCLHVHVHVDNECKCSAAPGSRDQLITYKLVTWAGGFSCRKIQIVYMYTCIHVHVHLYMYKYNIYSKAAPGSRCQLITWAGHLSRGLFLSKNSKLN